MNTHRFHFSIRKSISSAAALASAVSMAVLFAAGPTVAASNNGGVHPDSCQIAHAVCYKSCANELDWCYRDCDHKFMGCKPARQASQASQHTPPTGGVKGEKRQPNGASTTPPTVFNTRAPLSDGILGTGPGMGASRPSTTGSPASAGGRAPAAAPIQLR